MNPSQASRDATHSSLDVKNISYLQLFKSSIGLCILLETCVAFAYFLFHVARVGWSRLGVVFLAPLTLEINRSLLFWEQRVSHTYKKVYLLLATALCLFLEWVLLDSLNHVTTPRIIRLPGLDLASFSPDFPAGTSGNYHILVGREGAIKSPFTSSEEAILMTQATQSAMASGVPYVTGDDFSVIIPCRNEADYLSKTIRYTIDNTPRKYLKEIIIVDDASDTPLEQVINDELSASYRKLVKVYRFENKEGLIRARIFGADHSTAANIFFLDGHCRPKPGWIQPLLRHLKTNYKRLACPVIQDIHNDTWQDVGTSGYKMMFEWNFEFGWYDDLTDEVPVSAGGIIALTRKWWEESGKYDPGMLEWGGENLEQSMRTWMCGGEIYVVRDSFVGHIFSRPPKPNPENRLVRQIQKNQKRAALVWLDEYYKYFERFHSIVKSLDEGPGLEERIALRQKLGCQGFQWYVDKFRTAFERKGLLVDEFYHILHQPSRWCLTSEQRTTVDQSKSSGSKLNTVALAPCDSGDRRQRWLAVAGYRMLQNQDTSQCIDSSVYPRQPAGQFAVLTECDWNNVFQGNHFGQFWQFNTSIPGKIFSYVSQDVATVTGNDKMRILPDKAYDSSSICLESSLRLGTADDSSVNIPDETSPTVSPSGSSRVVFSSCTPEMHAASVWDSPQMFERYFVFLCFDGPFLMWATEF